MHDELANGDLAGKLLFGGAAMITTHAIFKGIFRLSIVAAAAAAAYTAYEGWQVNVQAYNNTLQMVVTYECGGRQSDDTLRAALNGARIDLSKVHCSNQPFFWASYNEIVQAREGTLRREKLSDIPMFRLNTEGAAVAASAIIWFVLVNGLGVVFVCGRTVVRWVHRGLQEYLT
jgi:hypothetical protein